MREQISIVTGVLGADVHIIGNSILAYALREAGFNVVTLGIFVSQADFIHAVQETAARAILVSSLYGHGEIDCRGFRDKCREAGLHDILAKFVAAAIVFLWNFNVQRYWTFRLGKRYTA